MNFKPIFFTSDWHIGHANVLKFDNRPFSSVEEMHEALITRYNATVTPYSVCYFLGDVGNKTEDVKKVIARLNGTKILVLGNHDKGMTTMYNCGFDVVLWSASLFIGDRKVTLSHCPLPGIWREDTSHINGSTENWHGETRKKHLMSTVPDEGQYHLHGHIHSRPDNHKSTKILDRQYDVGVAANNYTPVSMSRIESWITLNEKGGSNG